MKWKTELHRVLLAEFARLQKGNPQFSLRAFAKKLELSPGGLSQLMSGKKSWDLTPDRAVKLVNHLRLPLSEKERLLTIIGVQPRELREKINPPDYDVLLDWTYPAVLACFDLPAEKRTPEKISARLGVSEENVARVVEKLMEKGFLVKPSPDCPPEKNPAFWCAGDGSPSEVIRQHHKNNTLRAKGAIDTIPAESRHFSSLTFAGSLAQLECVREEIRLFHEKIMSLLNQGEGNDEVIQLSVNLFPVRAEISGSAP